MTTEQAVVAAPRDVSPAAARARVPAAAHQLAAHPYRLADVDGRPRPLRAAAVSLAERRRREPLPSHLSGTAAEPDRRSAARSSRSQAADDAGLHRRGGLPDCHRRPWPQPTCLPVWGLYVVLVGGSLTSTLSIAGARSFFPLIVPRDLWDRGNAADSVCLRGRQHRRSWTRRRAHRAARQRGSPCRARLSDTWSARRAAGSRRARPCRRGIRPDPRRSRGEACAMS